MEDEPDHLAIGHGFELAAVDDASGQGLVADAPGVDAGAIVGDLDENLTGLVSGPQVQAGLWWHGHVHEGVIGLVKVRAHTADGHSSDASVLPLGEVLSADFGPRAPSSDLEFAWNPEVCSACLARWASDLGFATVEMSGEECHCAHRLARVRGNTYNSIRQPEHDSDIVGLKRRLADKLLTKAAWAQHTFGNKEADA